MASPYDRFEWQYDKDFAGNRLLIAYTIDQIHKRVQVLLHGCNTISLNNVDKSGP